MKHHDNARQAVSQPRPRHRDAAAAQQNPLAEFLSFCQRARRDQALYNGLYSESGLVFRPAGSLQHNKGRDLFDLDHARTVFEGLNTARIAECFRLYPEKPEVTIFRAEAQQRIFQKLVNLTFFTDMRPLLQTDRAKALNDETLRPLRTALALARLSPRPQTAAVADLGLAGAGAILGHANPRSTVIYAHAQADPSKRAANRVTKKIAAALAGADQSPGRRKSKPRKVDDAALRNLADQLAQGSPEAEHIRAALSGQQLKVAVE